MQRQTFNRVGIPSPKGFLDAGIVSGLCCTSSDQARIYHQQSFDLLHKEENWHHNILATVQRTNASLPACLLDVNPKVDAVSKLCFASFLFCPHVLQNHVKCTTTYICIYYHKVIRYIFIYIYSMLHSTYLIHYYIITWSA